MTPNLARRNPEGLYRIEARWDTNERAALPDSMAPHVIVGADFYPMQRTALTNNRWEAVVPVPPGQRFLLYRFKFDYRVSGFGKKVPKSKLSLDYQLEIVE